MMDVQGRGCSDGGRWSTFEEKNTFPTLHFPKNDTFLYIRLPLTVWSTMSQAFLWTTRRCLPCLVSVFRRERRKVCPASWRRVTQLCPSCRSSIRWTFTNARFAWCAGMFTKEFMFSDGKHSTRQNGQRQPLFCSWWRWPGLLPAGSPAERLPLSPAEGVSAAEINKILHYLKKFSQV